ncbi:hypothetical protein GW17_00017273 [Ensete ventricosum]|nr:hypothetical protein GW17_00017273 [Ensete ventricosum]
MKENPQMLPTNRSRTQPRAGRPWPLSEPGRLQFIYADLGDARAVNRIFAENAFDAVMHFAAVAYVGESTLEPLRYVIYTSISCRQNIDWILSAWLNFLLQPG